MDGAYDPFAADGGGGPVAPVNAMPAGADARCPRPPPPATQKAADMLAAYVGQHGEAFLHRAVTEQAANPLFSFLFVEKDPAGFAYFQVQLRAARMAAAPAPPAPPAPHVPPIAHLQPPIGPSGLPTADGFVPRPGVDPPRAPPLAAGQRAAVMTPMPSVGKARGPDGRPARLLADDAAAVGHEAKAEAARLVGANGAREGGAGVRSRHSRSPTRGLSGAGGGNPKRDRSRSPSSARSGSPKNGRSPRVKRSASRSQSPTGDKSFRRGRSPSRSKTRSISRSRSPCRSKTRSISPGHGVFLRGSPLQCQDLLPRERSAELVRQDGEEYPRPGAWEGSRDHSFGHGGARGSRPGFGSAGRARAWSGEGRGVGLRESVDERRDRRWEGPDRDERGRRNEDRRVKTSWGEVREPERQRCDGLNDRQIGAERRTGGSDEGGGGGDRQRLFHRPCHNREQKQEKAQTRQGEEDDRPGDHERGQEHRPAEWDDWGKHGPTNLDAVLAPGSPIRHSPTDSESSPAPAPVSGSPSMSEARVPEATPADMKSKSIVRRAVTAVVKDSLNQPFLAGTISKHQFKTIAKRAVDKVMSQIPARGKGSVANTTEGVEVFLTVARKQKIQKLIHGYVQKYTK